MDEILDNEIENVILRVQAKYPEFSYLDLREICIEYLGGFKKNTKQETLIKSLNKYINKEFQLDDVLIVEEKNKKEYCLDTIPKRFFGSGKLSAADSLVKINGLHKALGSSVLFVDADLHIRGNDKMALIGRNGTGKSTLLKMVIGVESLDEGIIELRKNLQIGYLSQDLFWASRDNSLSEEMESVFPEISSAIHELIKIKKNIETNSGDLIVLHERKKELETYLADNDGYNLFAMQTQILRYFGFEESQFGLKISQLSGGEQTKVQIAKFLLKDVDLLILDEPTNHLDIEGIMFLEKFCKLWNKGLVCISHDKKFIDNVFEKIVEISDKKLITYVGNYEKYLEQKQKNYEIALKNFNDQQKELARQNEFIERFRYKASKAAQVQSRIKMLDKIEILEQPEDELTLKDIKIKLDIRIPNLILRLTNLIVGYTETLIGLPAKIEITNDKKIGIIGKNGVGKTTLLRTILGEIKPISGNVYLNDKIKIGSYSQSSENLDMEKTVLDELVGFGVGQKEARNILGGLLISGDKVNQKIGTLSGGERAKVALTKMLLEKPHFIIMDEPTNHLDLYSKEVIKNMLKEFPGVSMVVSHDRDLLESISNQVWVIQDGMLQSFESLDRGFNQIFD